MTDTDPIANKGSLLIVEDDRIFRGQLMRAMIRRGFDVIEAASIADAKATIDEQSPDYAVVDMRLGDGNGLDLVPWLHERLPQMRIIILTGYGNIASAVAAVKSGAVDYLAKPAEPDEIAATLLSSGQEAPPPPENPMSVDRVRWEHIQRVYELCDRNVSETARRLNMHRRTLQRILAKRSPR